MTRPWRETKRMPRGWRQLVPTQAHFQGEGNYPLEAYSEFMPPPRVGWKPYGSSSPDPELFSETDPFGWHVSKFQEALELQPRLVQVGKQVIGKLAKLLDGDPESGIPRLDLADNPYWPRELAAEPKLPQE